MTIDLTVLSYVILVIVGYYAVLFMMSRTRTPAPVAPDSRPLIVILVPARNEELVLDETLSNLARLDYTGDYRILVVNDASTDDTARIADEWGVRDPRVRARHRTPAEAGMKLTRPPCAPREHAWISAAVARIPDAWLPFLAIAS